MFAIILKYAQTNERALLSRNANIKNVDYAKRSK